MKSIITIFILFLTLTTHSQVDDSVFYYTYAQLIASRDSVSILKQIIAQKDTVISKQKEIIKNDSLIQFNYDKIKPAQPEKSLIEWQGFYLGISTTYGIDSNVLHNTVLGNLRYAIYGTARVRIGLVELWAGYEIPFDDKLKIKIGAGYRIF